MSDRHDEMRGAPELEAAGYAREIEDAPILHRWLTLADLAHALELHRVGALPAQSRLLEGLLLLWEADAEAVGYDPALGEVYTSREYWLRGHIGNDAGHLHLGRTRREAVRTAFRMACRVALADLIESIAQTVEIMCEQSRAWSGMELPDYTYLQPAQPTTFGHYVLSFTEPLVRDGRRLVMDLRDVDASPAGSGAANGSAVAMDRDRMARQLGFLRPIRHLRDAMWQTDPFLHATLDATSIVLTLDRLAEDLEIYSSREFGFVSLGDGLVRPSILMPQKRNPYALSVVRGTAALLIGRSGTQMALAKSPSARSDALIYSYGEVPRALEWATRGTRLMAAVINTLRVDDERMRQALTGAHVEATDVAHLLCAATDMDYSSAHAVVARALRDGHLSAATVQEAASEVLGRDIVIDAAEIQALADPQFLIGRRTLPGGPGDIADMAAEYEAEQRDMQALVQEARSRWSQAEAQTINEARRVAGTQGGQT
ncbi:MAG: lyase family protein [Actinomycetota bacterium]